MKPPLQPLKWFPSKGDSNKCAFNTTIMYTLKDFDDIRPFNDDEINAALHRIVNVNEFGRILEFLFPEKDKNEIIAELKQITTALDFQKQFMHPLVNSIVQKTSKGLTCSGFEYLVPGTPYLFVANHRDIVLDSAMLQVLLLDNGHLTSEISFGSNLMINPFIVDLGRVNRMFKVIRSGNRMEMFRNSKILSSYIRHTITQKGTSAWIAQRNGRTKDGNDKTESGLLKMLNISGTCEFEDSLSELNIVPLSISYEFEPCCAMKINETSIILKGLPYHKAPNEDLRSILAGITQQKGRIHMAVCPPVNHFLHESRDITNYNDRINLLASRMDTEIFRHFRLWPGNYIACDLVNGDTKYSGFYSPAEKLQFIDYMHRELSSLNLDNPEHRDILLKLYANPVLNAASVEEK
jgi:hypothetical protein